VKISPNPDDSRRTSPDDRVNAAQPTTGSPAQPAALVEPICICLSQQHSQLYTVVYRQHFKRLDLRSSSNNSFIKAKADRKSSRSCVAIITA
jgi:hypothetical protein